MKKNKINKIKNKNYIQKNEYEKEISSKSNNIRRRRVSPLFY